jgi:hypothetical protein
MPAPPDDTLLDRLQCFPDAVAAWLDRWPVERRRIRPAGGGFSLVEQLCHLRDLEREGFVVRIRRIVDEDMPELQEIDGSSLAIERDYRSQDARAAWRDWRTARQETVALLRAALPRHAARTGIYGGFGVVTLAELARGIAAHDESHREEMAAWLGNLTS